MLCAADGVRPAQRGTLVQSERRVLKVLRHRKSHQLIAKLHRRRRPPHPHLPEPFSCFTCEVHRFERFERLELFERSECCHAGGVSGGKHKRERHNYISTSAEFHILGFCLGRVSSGPGGARAVHSVSLNHHTGSNIVAYFLPFVLLTRKMLYLNL